MDLHTIVDRLVQKAVAPIMQSISSLHQLGDRVEQLEAPLMARSSLHAFAHWRMICRLASQKSPDWAMRSPGKARSNALKH